MTKTFGSLSPKPIFECAASRAVTRRKPQLSKRILRLEEGMDMLQRIVQELMRIVLEDFPETLDGETINYLATTKNPLGFKLSYTLIRRDRDGRYRERYYADPYGDRWYVCSQWNKQYHPHNAQKLVVWIGTLIDRTKNTAARNRLLNIRDRLSALKFD